MRPLTSDDDLEAARDAVFDALPAGWSVGLACQRPSQTRSMTAATTATTAPIQVRVEKQPPMAGNV